MKTLQEYSLLIEKNKAVPGALAELAETLSADYMMCSDLIIKLKLIKPEAWITIKRSGDKPLSDKLTDMEWQRTEEGTEEMKLKYRMKALEKAMSTIKQHIYVLNTEAYNVN